jgi:hypothetical protein
MCMYMRRIVSCVVCTFVCTVARVGVLFQMLQAETTRLKTFTSVSLENRQEVVDPNVEHTTPSYNSDTVSSTPQPVLPQPSKPKIQRRVDVLDDLDDLHLTPTSPLTTHYSSIPRFIVPVGTHYGSAPTHPKGIRPSLIRWCRLVLYVASAVLGKGSAKKMFPQQHRKQALVFVVRVIFAISFVSLLGTGVLYLLTGSILQPGESIFFGTTKGSLSVDQADARELEMSVWNAPFPLFDNNAIALKEFQGVGRKLDDLLNKQVSEMCVTGAELGIPVPYFVLRGFRNHHPNRHYVNAFVTPVETYIDNHGRQIQTSVQWRTEVATHCQFPEIASNVDSYENFVDNHLAMTQQLRGENRDDTTQSAQTKTSEVYPVKQTTSPLHTKYDSSNPETHTSFFWNLHVRTQTWLAKPSTTHTSGIGSSNPESFTDDVQKHVLTRKRKRYTQATIVAIDGVTGNPVTHTLTENDAFCAQAYHDIAQGEWPCETGEIIRPEKSEL